MSATRFAPGLVRSSRPKRFALAAIGWVLAVLAFLSGCERSGDFRGSGTGPPWPQGAVVAELAHLPSAQAAEGTLADLKAIGFDTVLFPGPAAPSALRGHWLETARSLQLRAVVRVGSPEAAGSAYSGGGASVPDGQGPRADGWILTLENPGDLASARDVRQALREAGADTVLIAGLAARGAAETPRPALAPPADVFDAILVEDASRDARALLNAEDPMPPSVFAGRYPPGDGAPVPEDSAARWHRMAHCRRSGEGTCSEDIRLLVMAMMQAPVPVVGFIDDPFWREVYRSLIRLRRETPLIRKGRMEWYAVDDEAGALAYRITNPERDHVLVALNVSSGHHELPLPFGFMAVSKVKLWASYDPRVRELVTSKPVALPAGSAVVVVED